MILKDDVLRSLILEANPHISDADIRKLIYKYWEVIHAFFR